MSHSLALLLGSRRVPRWVVDAIDRVERNGTGCVENVFVPETTSPASPDKGLRFYVDQVREKGCWTPVAAGQKLVGAVLGPLPALERVPVMTIDSVDEERIETCGLERPSEHRCELSASAVDALTGTDVAFHWGIGILTGEVLSAPEHGVLGVHQGNVREYRGGPPGFWEYLHGDDQAGVTLQRYTEDLDAGGIVAERTVDVDDAHTWRSVRRRLCTASARLLVDGLDKLGDDGIAVDLPEKLGPVYRPSQRTCKTTVQYLGRALPGWMRELANS
ncbi:formyltransferase family protein [Halorientalis salina]|uniref:formyltransferase family protein n=1 Tax=Halorientalis salina TaxID=2932266 RepID=UPI0010AD1128|nr:formyltransferase family protein [Halorientalis salina]